MNDYIDENVNRLQCQYAEVMDQRQWTQTRNTLPGNSSISRDYLDSLVSSPSFGPYDDRS